MEFIQRYNQNKDKLTKSENKLANYIASHTEHVIYDTIKSLGTATNTGDATIVRLCKKLGYSGFSDLKIALAQDSTLIQCAPWTPSRLILSRSQTTITSGTKRSSSVKYRSVPSGITVHAFPRR